MPSHSSCDCAHSCMDLSQARQVHSIRVVFLNTQQKQSEVKRRGLMERQTLDNCTACEVSERAHVMRGSWAFLPCTAGLQL